MIGATSTVVVDIVASAEKAKKKIAELVAATSLIGTEQSSVEILIVAGSGSLEIPEHHGQLRHKDIGSVNPLLRVMRKSEVAARAPKPGP